MKAVGKLWANSSLELSWKLSLKDLHWDPIKFKWKAEPHIHQFGWFFLKCPENPGHHLLLRVCCSASKWILQHLNLTKLPAQAFSPDSPTMNFLKKNIFFTCCGLTLNGWFLCSWGPASSIGILEGFKLLMHFYKYY